MDVQKIETDEDVHKYAKLQIAYDKIVLEMKHLAKKHPKPTKWQKMGLFKLRSLMLKGESDYANAKHQTMEFSIKHRAKVKELTTAQKIGTIGEFLEIIKPLFGREREKKELAKVFQALRIEVNREMEALKEMLYAATEALKPGGRLVVITYHSLEDRMVKNIMKTGNIEGKAEKDFFGNVQTPFRLVNNKVIVPDNDEIERNPRSRSAKLRIAEKL
jgi:16S rRNA (cytosine(1402)-N(4))-methyltransferase